MKKIIDIHAHAISVNKDATDCFVSKKLMNSVFFKLMRLLFDVKSGDSMQIMDEKISTKLKKILSSLIDIDYVVLLAFDGVYDKKGDLDEQNTNFYVTNDYVRTLSLKHEKVLYGASINPMRKDSLEELERVIKDGAVLVKWLPNTQGFDPNNKRFIDFYKILAKNNMPLLVHTGREYGLTVIDQKFGNFKNLMLPLNEGVTVIAAHGGGLAVESFTADYNELVGLLKDYPNFYIDTAALFLLNKRRSFYRLAKNKDIHNKIVYGSDWPIPSNPLLFLKNTSIFEVISSLSNKNFIQRNFVLTKKLNFGDDLFYNGYRLIKKDSKFESI